MRAAIGVLDTAGTGAPVTQLLTDFFAPARQTQDPQTPAT